MLIQLTTRAGHPIAVDAHDVHGLETLLFDAFGDPTSVAADAVVVATRIHCNRHGVTTFFDVAEDVPTALAAVNRARQPMSYPES